MILPPAPPDRGAGTWAAAWSAVSPPFFQHKEPMMSDELKLAPCPFCGGGATFEAIKTASGGTWSVGCQDEAGDCFGYQSFQEFARKCEAAAAWNRRAPAPAVPDDVAEPWRMMLRQAEDDLSKAHATTEAQAAELARIRDAAKSYGQMIERYDAAMATADTHDHKLSIMANYGDIAIGYLRRLCAALNHPTGGSND